MEHIKEYDLVIIGNGYDLHYDLPTNFSDFYISFKDIDIDLNDYLNKYEDLNKEDVTNYFNTVHNMKESNFFLKYFRNYNDVFLEWNNFENHLKRIIKEFKDILDLIKSNNYNCYKVKEGKDYYAIRMQTTIFNYVDKCNVYETYLGFEDSNIFKYIHFCCNNNLKSNDVVSKINKIIEVFPKALYRELQGFSKLFKLYLKTFIKHPEKKKINNFVKTRTVLTYNYTNFAEKFFEANTIYVHGDLSDNNNIVIGIEDNEDLGGFDIFAKNVQRANCKNKYMINFPPSSIAFLGHSISELDFDTLRNIKIEKKYLENITIFYYAKDDLSRVKLASNLKKLYGKKDYDEYMFQNIIEFIPIDE